MTSTRAHHVPVLLERVVELLAAAPDGVVVDATVGAGGHAAAIAQARVKRYGHAHIIGVDQDPYARAIADERLSSINDVTFELYGARFDALSEILGQGDVHPAGILFDLGLSSMQLDHADRGFSYRADGPLDMRMDPSLAHSAADVVNDLPAGELAHIIRTYGEERHANRIARAIVASRPITSSATLGEIVRDAIPAAVRRTGGHPATRTFQALRIYVNGELEALAGALPVAIEQLAVGGTCVVISYHSLEDRIVKRAFAGAAEECTCPPRMPVCACGGRATVELITRRPQRPSASEIAENPRSRSALLRAVRRLPGGGL